MLSSVWCRSMPPNVTIIICTRNRAESLRLTLESLRTVTVPEGWMVELLVVDNGSTDGTRAVVESADLSPIEVRYLFVGKPGKSRALNRGLAETTGEIVVFTDDDVRMHPLWLVKICQPIVHGQAECTTGHIKLAPHLSRPWMTNLHRSYLADTSDRNFSDVQEMVGANMAFLRKVLEKVTGFDSELGPGALGFAEDTFFSKQLLQAGFLLLGVADAQVEHHPDPCRLTRQSFLARARVQGFCHAYISHHWEHAEISRPLLRSLKVRLRLAFYRIQRRHLWPFDEGMADWEMRSVERLYYLDAIRKLSGSRRFYGRHALVKNS